MFSINKTGLVGCIISQLQTIELKPRKTLNLALRINRQAVGSGLEALSDGLVVDADIIPLIFISYSHLYYPLDFNSCLLKGFAVNLCHG